MTFLQPFILWGLPLVLLPVIIHLINRMRHKPQQWAAMRFLISATRASTSHAKLRQFLILLFRTLAVLMLLLFLARPLAGGWMGWMLSPAPDVVLILLDRSASMETKIPGNITKREQSLKLISDAAKQFEGASHLVLIDSATRSPQEIANARALSELSFTSATDTAANIPNLLQAAIHYLVENRAGSAEIWLASDLQRSNWQPDDARFKSALTQLASLPQKVRVRLLALNQTAENNRSISVQDLIRRAKGENAELQLTIDLQNNAENKQPFPVQTVLDGASSETQLTMDSQAMRWRHKLDLGAQRESGWGSLRLPSDANQQDNIAFFAYGSEIHPRTLVVHHQSRSGRFFTLAAGAIGKNKEAAQQISPEEFGAANLGPTSLVIWQAPLPSGAEAERVRNFIEQGGVVIFFPTGDPGTQQFSGISWGETQHVEDEKTFPILKWNESEGPLAKTDEGFSLPLAQTEFKRRQKITIAPGSTGSSTLASFEDGAPFLTRQVIGNGAAYFCASLPEQDWSSLGDGPVLVPMLQRVLQDGVKRLQPISFVNCGELTPADQQRNWTAVDSTAPKNPKFQAGVYRSGERWIAVNRPAAEDDPEILDINEAKNLFTGISFQMLQDKQTKTDALQGEIWRLFLFGMLAFLVGESLLILPGESPAKNEKPHSRKKEVAA